MVKLENEANMLITEFCQGIASQIINQYIIEEYLTFVGRIQCPQNVQQSTLASTRRTNNTHNFTFIDIDIYSL